MAEALLHRALGPEVHITSAGIDPVDIDPFVVSVMAEEGIDLSGHEARVFDAAEDPDFDLLIALSKTAWIAARTLSARTGVAAEYWQVSDPPSLLSGGSRNQILEGYRIIRNELAQHIRNRFDAEVRNPVPEMA